MRGLKPILKDAYLLGRFESFSDLVFGFTVPMMAVNIKVPATPTELAQSRKGLVIFAASFLLLCVLWLRHHRMMRRYFVPDPVGILLIFAILGTVALYTYPLQLYLRFPDNPLALRAYAWGFAFLCLLYLFMALYAYLRQKRTWDEQEASSARRAIVANGVVGAVMVAHPLTYTLGPAAFAILAAAMLIFRISSPWIHGRRLISTEESSLDLIASRAEAEASANLAD